MKLDVFLNKASRLARAGKYEAAVRTLEPEVNRYHGSHRYYYLLGSSCLRLGDFSGALTYFRLANNVKKHDPLAILGLAVLYIRRHEIDRAVGYYLEALAADPKNRIAKKALKLIRKQAGTDAFAAWLESGKLPSLYPPIPFPGFTTKEKISTLVSLLVMGIVAFGLLLQFRVIALPLHTRDQRQPTINFSLTREERMAPLQSGGSYNHEFASRVQAIESYERAMAMFTANRDEAARVNLNRILESNADESLKNRARVLMSFLEAPAGFDAFIRNDNVPFPVVDNNPILYRDVHVIWQGRAVNIRAAADSTTFDFLIGNEGRQILEGIAHVTFNHAIPLNPERALEVLGRILPVGSDGLIHLEGIAFHQSARLEH